MVMALSAVGRQAEINPAEGLDPIGCVKGQIFFVDGPPLIGCDIAALKPGCHQLIGGGIG